MDAYTKTTNKRGFDPLAPTDHETHQPNYQSPATNDLRTPYYTMLSFDRRLRLVLPKKTT